MNESALIKLDDVSFGYGANKILEDINLSILPEDFLVIIGPNGGGKTTLVRLILGLLKPSAGKISYYLKGDRGNIGYVPQFSTFEWQFPLQVRDVIRIGRIAHCGLLRRFTLVDEEAVTKMAKLMRISHLLNEMIGELSGGELQRVLISRAMISEPELLILDEPTASIDADSRNILNDLLSELNQRIPIILITHDATAMTANIKRIACINRLLYVHDSGEVSKASLEKVYGCPVELIAHGVPHRVLKEHLE